MPPGRVERSLAGREHEALQVERRGAAGLDDVPDAVEVEERVERLRDAVGALESDDELHADDERRDRERADGPAR